MTSRRLFLKTAAAAAALFGFDGAASLAAANVRAAGTGANASRKSARNIIFMVADGMCAASLALTRHYQSVTGGAPNRWLSLYAAANGLPPAVRSAVETSSFSSIVTDSSAASSCWGTGKRIKNGALNVDPETGRPLVTLFEKAKRAGMLTGLVTTATVTHATPAGFVAHSPQRNAEKKIAREYLDARVDVLLGGGTQFFDDALRAAYTAAGYEVFEKLATPRPVPEVGSPESKTKNPHSPVLGLFSEGHMPFSIDSTYAPKPDRPVPTLAAMSKFALERLHAASTAAGKGFIVQIEAARVDHAAHSNDAAALVHDLNAFDDALGTALAFCAAHPDTLLVVTTDHGCGGMNLNGAGTGYSRSAHELSRLARCKRSFGAMRKEARKLTGSAFGDYLREVTGLTISSGDLKRFAVALDATRAYSPDVMKSARAAGGASLGRLFGSYTALGWTGGQHTGDLAELAALGPGAERFTPFLRNDQIHNLLLKAVDIG